MKPSAYKGFVYTEVEPDDGLPETPSDICSLSADDEEIIASAESFTVSTTRNDDCPWMEEDFANTARVKTGGLTVSDYQLEVELWQQSIRSLKRYDEEDIRRYIDSCNWAVQPRGSNFDEVAEAYYRHARMATELTHLYNLVNPHVNFLKAAYASLKETAQAVAPGKTVSEKEANAAAMASPFLRHLTNAKSLLEYIADAQTLVNDNGWIMKAVSKERENFARLDSNMINDGGAVSFRKRMQSDQDS